MKEFILLFVVFVTGYVCITYNNSYADISKIPVNIVNQAQAAVTNDGSDQLQINLPHIFYKIGDPYVINGVKYRPYFNVHFKQTGTASWYGADFEHKKTANGDIFDSTLFTAAHPTLPLPSIVKVTNLKNHLTIYVLVNDRGPFVGKRCIDLSRAAAKALQFENQGTAKVKIEYDHIKTVEYLKKVKLYDQFAMKTTNHKRKPA